ncbi:MAG: bacteriophage abortive infection AbiH family protein [Roseburia sp.]|nr:bacteriophage abortive infection AbiH family protein [Roseburia sp.]MCM1280156.1 bacteriophage abortive infection AbiH family protein [Robinsoniella sp.]
MNITFMIGNGFDISLGLKTKYSDFYPYFLANADAENLLRKKLADLGDKAYVDWADLEGALGVFTEEIFEVDYEKFVLDKIEMDDLLVDYLKGEQAKFVLDEGKVKKKMLRLIEEIRQNPNEKKKDFIKGVFEYYIPEDRTCRAISFNYTNCLDQYFAIGEKAGILRSYTRAYDKYTETIGGVFHIHGTLEDGEMILGVNDEKQIRNAKMNQLLNVRRALIKPFLNEEIGQNKIRKAKNIIDNSGVICIYGMSIGDTDKMWWEYIGKWLLSSKYKALIIYNYDPKYSPGHSVRRLIHADQIKSNFMEKAGIPKDKREQAAEQIIVNDNINLFA